MRIRHLTTAVTATAALLLVGCGGPSAESDDGSSELTVWYMSGSLPDDVAAQAKRDFEAANPGVTVEYQVQQWDGIGEKLTTALAGDEPPDVLEIGNTQVAQYAAAGGLLDLTDQIDSFDNRDTWLPGLEDPGRWEERTYGVPFYAGTRTVVYRTDMFEQAGVAVPTTWDQLLATGEPLRTTFGSDPRFAPMYLPGQQWYTLASLVWDAGGDLAVREGDSWQGALSSPQAQQGIAAYRDLYQALSTAPADTDEASPQQYEILSQNGAAMMIGLPWELASTLEAAPELDGKLAVFPLPSAAGDDAPAPPFVGGSDLAVPAGSDSPDLGRDFIALLAGTEYQTLLAENGAIPNSSALSDAATDNEVLQVGIEAASVGRATPIAPGWNSVETSPNPIKDMLTQVLQGASIAEAAAATDEIITERMNP